MKEILKFYRKVFEQELNQAKQLHLFSSRIIKRIFLTGQEELINAEQPIIPISDSQALPLVKEMAIKGNSSELKYYSLARLSSFTLFNKYSVTHIYPLISFNASLIEKDGNYFIELDLSSREVLKNNFQSEERTIINFDKLESNLITDFNFVSQLANALDKVAESKGDELRMFPKLWTGQQIKKKQKTLKKGENYYLSCAAICLIEKEKYSYSTLDELKSIEDNDSFSSALKTVFKRNQNHALSERGIICNALNFWQFQAIENCNRNVVSVISGPPGTGKSYTIANIAAEKVSKGERVLISSKNGEALDVIEHKIQENLQLKNLVINASKHSNLWNLKDHLKTILGRSYKHSNIKKADIDNDRIEMVKNIEKTAKLEKEMSSIFKREKAILENVDTNNFTKKSSIDFRNRIIKARGIQTIPLWQQLQSYYNELDVNKDSSIDILKRYATFKMEHNLNKNRADLRMYYNFLRARDLDRKSTLSKQLNHKHIINTFPIWLVKASEVARVIPNEQELFDYVIIDEASQCDIPTIIPLLQRAKKCIVVGDENQLGHISFLSKSFEGLMKKEVPIGDRYLCSHRNNSFLSLVKNSIDPESISYLSEHFRSKHAIIEFSNKEIYNNQLQILTKRPINDYKAVEFISVSGEHVKSSNLAEIEQIIEKIIELISNEISLPIGLKTTIGILSPFRNQADKLFTQIKKRLLLSQIQDHKIMVGTAFSFQGNERDLMILSLVLDDNSPAGSYNYINRKDVFNVSITRARTKQLIYHSFSPKKLKFESTLQSFFSFYEKYISNFRRDFSKDEFCNEIEDYITKFGFETWQQFEISGVSIDVLASKNDKYIAIDLVGFPGEIGDFYALERYKMLERGKIKIFPLPFAYWLYDRSFCLKAIEKLCLGV